MLLTALLLGILAGYLRGGRLRNLEKLDIRAGGVVLGALVVQILVPPLVRRLHLPDQVALWFWLATFLVLIGALLANRDRLPLLVAAVGVGLNFLVILLNGGMPVSRWAMEVVSASSRSGTEALATDPLYHVASAGTRLLFLADTIPVPWPALLRGIASVGDIVLMAGVLWLVQGEMCYHGKRRIS